MRLSPASGMEGREKAKKTNALLVKGRDPQARGAAVWPVDMRSISQRSDTEYAYLHMPAMLLFL